MTDHRGRKPWDSDYGLGEHFIDGDELGLLDPAALAKALMRTFHAPAYHPPRLPAVATQLLALSQRTDVTYEAIENLLEQDPVLSGEVLAVARSAFYSRSVPVDSLREALIRVGTERLGDIVLQAALNLRVFRSAAHRDAMEALRVHCHAVAHLSRIVASFTPLAGERSFLCGLLHDVGIAGVLLVVGDAGRGKPVPELGKLWPSIDEVHSEIGARMATLWNLPADIAAAIGAHHQVVIGGQDHPLAAIVCVAEDLALSFGRGFRAGGERSKGADPAWIERGPIDRSGPAVVRRARAALGLDAKALALVREAVQQWADVEAAASRPGAHSARS